MQALGVGRGRGQDSFRRVTAEHAHALLSGALALAIASCVGGPAGLVTGPVAGVVVLLVLRRRHRRAIRTDPLVLAACLDLLAACLRAGLPVSSAVSAVAQTAPDELAEPLRRTAELLALGAEADTAWAGLADHPDTESFARLARRSARSGVSLAAGIAELAAERRAAAQDDASAGAERAGVLISGPLGLCFLPAFVCLGIVPVVVGLAGQVLGGGVL